MKITFDNWIKNPTGGSSVLTNTQIYRTLYNEKLSKILVRQAGRVDYKLYKDSAHDKYYCYIKIWSEVIRDFSYDTVIEFYTDTKALEGSPSLENYFVRFYSNDPAFVYTFAHAYIKNDLFIKDLESRMAKLAVKEKAKVKNPKDEIGYVKSLFFAYLIMKSRGLFLKVSYKASGINYDAKMLAREITPADIKIEERQNKQVDLNKTVRVDKMKKQTDYDNQRKNNNPDMFSSNSGNVRQTRTTGFVNKTSVTKTSNKIKRK